MIHTQHEIRSYFVLLQIYSVLHFFQFPRAVCNLFFLEMISIIFKYNLVKGKHLKYEKVSAINDPTSVVTKILRTRKVKYNLFYTSYCLNLEIFTFKNQGIYIQVCLRLQSVKFFTR